MLQLGGFTRRDWGRRQLASLRRKAPPPPIQSTVLAPTAGFHVGVLHARIRFRISCFSGFLLDILPHLLTYVDEY